MVLLHVTAAVLVLKVELVTSLLIVLCGSLGDVCDALLGFFCGVFVVVVGIVDVNVGDDGDLVVEWFFVVSASFISLFSAVVVVLVVEVAVVVLVVVVAVVVIVSFTSVIAVLFSVV